MEEMDKVIDDFYENRMTREEAITQLASLIQETEKVIRSSSSESGMLTAHSPMLQQLLYSYYKVPTPTNSSVYSESL